MRGRDENTGEFLGPSRSQQRREALEVFALSERLVELPDPQLAKLPMSEALLQLVRESRKITAQIARKRQLQYLAKQLRREDDETLQAITDALDAGSASSRRETAVLHRAENWRERLLSGEGDAALTELLETYPDADRQRLRQLMRNANEEKARNKSPRAFRELFRELREVLGEAGMGNGE